jgi:hypothetical protein
VQIQPRALLPYAVLGGLVGFIGLEGVPFGLALAVAPLLLIIWQGRTRLQRLGGYLFGLGIVPCFFIVRTVIRIHNVCVNGELHSGPSYECYSASTAPALVVFAGLTLVGVALIVLAVRGRRQPPAPVEASPL